MWKKTVTLASLVVFLVGFATIDMKPVKVQADVETKLDKADLAIDGFKLDIPVKAPVIDEATAIANARQSFGDLSQGYTDVQVEYHLVTNPNFQMFSPAALNKNPNLKAKKHMEKTPAYIVTFKGVSIHLSQPSSTGAARINHEVNVVIDATSGEPLMAFSDK